MRLRNLVLRIASILAVLATLGSSFANAGLVYWQNFEGANGAADVGTGDLVITNTTGGSPGTTTFDAANGVFGGSCVATGNVPSNASANFNGVASTVGTGGTSLSALPNSGLLDRFTVSFWFKTEALYTVANRTSRLIILGTSGTTDLGTANSLAFAQLGSNGTGANASRIIPQFGTVDLSQTAVGTGVGPTNTVGEWTFVAMTYDGNASTAPTSNNSSVQLGATAGVSQTNGQFYRGTDTASVIRSDLQVSASPTVNDSITLGAINLGTNAALFLANSNARTRAFDGTMDDVRIYDGVLTAAEIEGVRLEGLAGIAVIPEPSTCALVGMGLVGLSMIRKRRNTRA